jgi:hypothetical protein
MPCGKGVIAAAIGIESGDTGADEPLNRGELAAND